MREIVNVTIRLVAIMVIAGLALGGAYTITKDPIAQQKAAAAEAARKAVLPEATAFEEITVENGGNVTECYRGLASDGSTAGYSVSVNAKGFGGTIGLTVGLKDGAITAVRMGSHSETPGLGAKAAEPKFLDQFPGKSGELLVNKKGATNEQEISAITAATITSQAVTNAVNEVLEFSAYLKEGSNVATVITHKDLFAASQYKVLHAAVSFGDIVDVNQGMVTFYAPAYDGGENLIGYAIAATAQSFGGPIDMTVGVDLNGTITGVRFDRNSESPDYGAKMTQPEFYNQFEGKSGQLTVVAPGTSPAANEIVTIHDVDAGTTSTSTSNTVVAAINEVTAYFASNLN